MTTSSSVNKRSLCRDLLSIPRVVTDLTLQLMGAIYHLLPDTILQICERLKGNDQREYRKVVATRTARIATYFFLIHLLAITGALTIVILNTGGVWIGKDLTGEVGEDGKKLFTLQVVAKIHELLMVASVSRLLWAAILRSLVNGGALPFAVLETGSRLTDVSLLWSKQFIALCFADFHGKTPLLLLICASMAVGLFVGPASATGMAPTMTDWHAGSTPVNFNISSASMWPSVLDQSTPSQLHRHLQQANLSSSHWTGVKDNLFGLWGRPAFGQIQSVPEHMSIGSPASIRAIDGRFRGPFTLYQPLITAVTVQPAAMADHLNKLRLLWFRDNANQCSWARLRVRTTGDLCGYRDLQFSMAAQQPVVFTACSALSDSSVVAFPSMVDGKGPVQNVNVNLDDQSATSDGPVIHWVDLNAHGFVRPSIGAIVNMNDSSLYACAVDAQWAPVTLRSSFIGTPFQVLGSPPDFFMPESPECNYGGRKVTLDTSWATALMLTEPISGGHPSLLELLLQSGELGTLSEGKVEAALAIAIVEHMAWIQADATLMVATDSPDLSWTSLQSSLREASLDQETMTFRVAVTGFAYGIHTANGISTSALLSTLILSLYILLSAILLAMDLRSHVHVHFCGGITDLVALAALSSIGNELDNCSSGVSSIRTLALPVALREKVGGTSVEMVVDAGGSLSALPNRKTLVPGKLYG